MTATVIHNARLLTLAGTAEPRRGHGLRDCGVIDPGWIAFDEGRISNLGDGSTPAIDDAVVIDAQGSVVMPCFVDCHTHLCWAGNRFDEFEQRLRGASYLQILEAGGGIMSTVRAVRAATEDELLDGLRLRLARLTALGTGAVEIKSGYGLRTEDELKMLRAIERMDQEVAHTIVATFLGAHAKDPDQADYVKRTINETLPAVATSYPGITCDAYCESGAWSLEETRRLFEKAVDLGCPLRVHADQFNSLGMTRLAVEMGARSVDHLEATTPDDLEHLAHSDTIGVALPCSGFHLDDRYAPARSFVDAGGALAIATNYNPGSAPTPSMPFTIALACRKLGLTPHEAITAATFNAACVLNLQDELGSLEVGKRADLQILDCCDERELAYELALPGPRMTIIAGEVITHRPMMM
jgi:imidazolonepropionase